MEASIRPTSEAHEGARAWRWLLGLWAAAAVAFALSGVMMRLPPLVIPLMIGGATVATIVAVSRSASLRAPLDAAPLWPFILFHAIRAPIGLGFLWLGARGELHPTFVAVAAWGDIAAGLGAVVATMAARAPRRGHRRAVVLAWNVLGLLDILVVIFTAQRILLFGEGMTAMRGLARFPGPLLPALVVPLVILTHLLVFRRLRAAAG